MTRSLKLLLVPTLFLAMLFAAAPQESEGSWWRRGRAWRGPYVARYHHAPHYRTYRVVRPHAHYSYSYCAPRAHWGPRYSGFYHYGW